MRVMLLPVSWGFLAVYVHLTRAEAGCKLKPSSPTIFLEDEGWLS